MLVSFDKLSKKTLGSLDRAFPEMATAASDMSGIPEPQGIFRRFVLPCRDKYLFGLAGRFTLKSFVKDQNQSLPVQEEDWT